MEDLNNKIDVSSYYGSKPRALSLERLLNESSKKKTKRISVRLYEEDFLSLRERALEERMPYQTLVGRLICKYVRGELKMNEV